MQRIAFLGLGAMGRRMATRLIAAGHEVAVWNRSPEPTAALHALGAHVAQSPRAAVADADVVIAMVFDDAASRRVWLDPHDGAAAGMRAGVVAVESSTLSPAWIAELGATLAERAIPLVDAPVAGSRPQAEGGQLVFMVGGDAQAVTQVTPVLRAMGHSVHAVGAAGSGAWLKLAVNALFGTQVLAMAEQLSALRAAGLDLPAAVDALRAMPVTSAAAGGAAALMLAGNYAPQAPVDLITKDLSYALAAAAERGRDLPLTAAVKARFELAQAAGYGSENLVAVARLYA
jgi:3-hydroxyisobutyrate dehydrogenase